MQIGIYSHFISKNNSNPKELWKTVRQKKKTSSKKSNSTVSLIEADGVLHTEKSAIARVLNVHLSLIGDKLAMKIEEKLKSAVNKSKTFFLTHLLSLFWQRKLVHFFCYH